MLKKYICFDIGGTQIKYGIVANPNPLKSIYFMERNRIDTEAQFGGPSICNKIKNIVRELIKQHEIEGVCISSAGMVDCDKGEIIDASDLIPNYVGTNFKRLMEEEFQLPCEVENDVNCAGLAECIDGVAKESKVTFCMTVGTGIGGAIIMNGKVYHGTSNGAGEIGYMHILNSDFESLGATSILSKKVAEQKREEADVWNGIHIFEEAKKGDEICIQAINEMVDILGRGIANICYVLNPDMVVLGGGIMAQQEYLKVPLEKALDQYLIPGIRRNTRLAFASNQNDAGMLGAYYHFIQRRNELSVEI